MGTDGLAAFLTSLPAGIPYKPKLVDWLSTEVSKTTEFKLEKADSEPKPFPSQANSGKKKYRLICNRLNRKGECPLQSFLSAF